MSLHAWSATSSRSIGALTKCLGTRWSIKPNEYSPGNMHLSLQEVRIKGSNFVLTSENSVVMQHRAIRHLPALPGRRLWHPNCYRATIYTTMKNIDCAENTKVNLRIDIEIANCIFSNSIEATERLLTAHV